MQEEKHAFVIAHRSKTKENSPEWTSDSKKSDKTREQVGKK